MTKSCISPRAPGPRAPRVGRFAATAALSLAALFPALYSTGARAGMFDDDEARRQIVELRGRVDNVQRNLNDRLDSLRASVEQLTGTLGRVDSAVQDKRAVMDIAAQVDSLRGDLANIRGQNEVLLNKADNLERRQRDLYVDLDTRIRKMEQTQTTLEQSQTAIQQAQAAVVDKLSAPERQAAKEKETYEAALNQFKQNNFGSAIAAFQGFMSTFPSSALVPSAQYWIGNAYYALRDYKSSINAQMKLVTNWPDNAKAPDALLNIASSQGEMGDAKAARETLLQVQKRYPTSDAAGLAKQRLTAKR